VLSELFRRVIIDEVDHRNVNTDVEWLRGLNPTTEVLASVFWDRLESLAPCLVERPGRRDGEELG
jgi:6-pyruvoyl-tetrahydropterin synthase